MIDHWIDGMRIVADAVDIGIYPQAVEGGPSPYKKRSDYMNGWNAASMELSEHMWNLIEAADKDRENWRYGLDLIRRDVGWAHFGDDKGGPRVVLNVNDTFAYACADAEDTQPSDWPLLCELHDAFGYDGVTAWVAGKRGCDPIQPAQTDKYRAARQFLDSKTSTVESSPDQS